MITAQKSNVSLSSKLKKMYRKRDSEDLDGESTFKFLST